MEVTPKSWTCAGFLSLLYLQSVCVCACELYHSHWYFAPRGLSAILIKEWQYQSASLVKWPSNGSQPAQLTGQAMARLASLLNWPSNGSQDMAGLASLVYWPSNGNQDMAGLASLVYWKSDGSQDMAGLASLVYWKSDGSQDMAGLASLVYWKSDGSQDMAGLASLVYWPMWTVSTESHQKVLLSHGLLAHWTQVYRRLDTCLRSSNTQGSSREREKQGGQTHLPVSGQGKWLPQLPK